MFKKRPNSIGDVSEYNQNNVHPKIFESTVKIIAYLNCIFIQRIAEWVTIFLIIEIISFKEAILKGNDLKEREISS